MAVPLHSKEIPIKTSDKGGKYSCLYESLREILPAEGRIPADFSCIWDGGNGKMTCSTSRDTAEEIRGPISDTGLPLGSSVSQKLSWSLNLG